MTKAVPIALESPREWLMLPPQDYYKLNHRTTQAVISSHLLLQPGSDNADQAAWAFFPPGSWKIPGMQISQPLWTTIRSLTACTVNNFFLYISPEHPYFNLEQHWMQHSRLSGMARNGSTFPGPAAWASPDTAQHPVSTEGMGRAYRTRYRRNYRSPEGTDLQKQLWYCPAPSTFPLHWEKLAQSLPSD